MAIEKEKAPQPSINDLPEPQSADAAADKIKGGRNRANPTESGDVTQNGTSGGDQG